MDYKIREEIKMYMDSCGCDRATATREVLDEYAQTETETELNTKLQAVVYELAGALREISSTVAPKGSHAAIMKRIADRALTKAGL